MASLHLLDALHPWSQAQQCASPAPSGRRRPEGLSPKAAHFAQVLNACKTVHPCNRAVM